MLLGLLTLGFNSCPACGRAGSSPMGMACSGDTLPSVPALRRTHRIALHHRRTRMQEGGEEPLNRASSSGSGRPDVLEQPAPPPPGAFHPGIVCAVKQQLIVGFRYDRPATAEDQQAARTAGYQPIATYSLCQEAFDELPPEDQATFQRVAPAVDPARLAVAAFVASLVLGSVGGVLSTGRLLDGSWNGAPPLEEPSDYAELPQLSPAEKLVALIFKPPSCEPESRTSCR